MIQIGWLLEPAQGELLIGTPWPGQGTSTLADPCLAEHPPTRAAPHRRWPSPSRRGPTCSDHASTPAPLTGESRCPAVSPCVRRQGATVEAHDVLSCWEAGVCAPCTAALGTCSFPPGEKVIGRRWGWTPPRDGGGEHREGHRAPLTTAGTLWCLRCHPASEGLPVPCSAPAWHRAGATTAIPAGRMRACHALAGHRDGRPALLGCSG